MKISDMTGKPFLVQDSVAVYKNNSGEYFTAEYTASVNNNSRQDIKIVTGSSYTHLFLKPTSPGTCKVELYEAPPNVTGGVAVTVYNMNRNSAKTSEVIVTQNPTVTDAGSVTILSNRLIVNGKLDVSSIILKTNTTYLLRIQNVSGAAVLINGVLCWYDADVTGI